MRIVFFGAGRYVVPTLEMLKDNYDLALVVTTELGEMQAVPFFCKLYKKDFITVSKASDLISNFQLEGSNADLGVVANFGVMIPQNILDLFPLGVLNIHPSLLPKYRGPTPGQTAILNNEKETGVTIMKVDKAMDHGPILAQEKTFILPTDTAESLYNKLFKQGSSMLGNILTKYEQGGVLLREQNHDEATFTQMLKREDGFINPQNPPQKEELERIARAYYPWPGAWTTAKLVPQGPDKVIKFLPEGKIQVEGGKEMPYKDFANGYPLGKQLLSDFHLL